MMRARALALSCLALLVVSAHAGELSSSQLESWSDTVFDQAVQQGRVSGLVISVVGPKGIILEKAYGYADRASKQLVSPQTTQFRLGSVTKTFTATAIAQLIERGYIQSLDQPVNELLRRLQAPDVFGRQISVRDLLTHRAGFEDSIYGMGLATNTLSGQDLRRSMPRIVRPPGSESVYSNFGFSLLGALIEDLSGQSYEDYVRDHIFTPLGMRDTALLMTGDTPALARASVISDSGQVVSFPMLPMSPALAPAGAIVSTGRDMSRYLAAHLGASDSSKLLSPSMLQDMHRMQVTNAPAMSGFAMAFIVSQWNGQPVVEHSGSWPGYRALMLLLPDLHIGVFIAAAGGMPRGGPEAAILGEVARTHRTAWALDGPEMRASILQEILGPVSQLPYYVPGHDASVYIGTYLSERRPYSTIEVLRNLLESPSNQITVRAKDSEILNIGGAADYREVAADVWQSTSLRPESSSMSTAEAYGFIRNAQGEIEKLVPAYAISNYTKVTFWRNPTVLNCLLRLTLLGSAIGLLAVFWSTSSQQRALTRGLMLLQGILAVAVFAFIYTDWIPGSGFVEAILMAQRQKLGFLLVVTNLMAMVTVALLVSSAMQKPAASKGNSRDGIKYAANIHKSAVIVSGILLIAVFIQTNLIGIHLP